MPELSVIIPARCEEWLNRTVADVLAHAKADTEIIVILDGAWPNEPIEQHEHVHVAYVPASIGQRAATNLGARISTADYVMKLDAHCSVAEGFDVELIRAAKELGPDVTQIPAQHNLHVFDRVCQGCGRRDYQGPTDVPCVACGETNWRKEVVWNAKRRRTEFWHLDADLRFQYGAGEYQKSDAAKGEIADVMTSLGACVFLSRDFYWKLGGFDESIGSWGQFGQELACKTWLSGGRHVVNKRTWFSHCFRTQGHDFGFPYPISGVEQEHARQRSREIWLKDQWPGAVRPLRWLVDKFWPVPGWTEEQREALPRDVAGRTRVVDDGHEVGRRTDRLGASGEGSKASVDSSGGGAAASRSRVGQRAGVVYYSDNRIDEALRRTVINQILLACDFEIAAVVLNAQQYMVDGGDTVSSRWRVLRFEGERGYLTMFKQILAGLEAIDTEFVFFCEHDVLYHQSHFDFVPPNAEQVFYNQHVYKVDAATGRALHYRCSQTSGLCANRELLLEHYRKRIALVERQGYSRAMGFEPGTHRRKERVDDLTAASWMSAYPNVDIRHGANLTPSRWRREQFRNQKYCEGWTEGDAVPGWGVTKGRFEAFLGEVRSGSVQQAVA